jgi:hypothetical protein
VLILTIVVHVSLPLGWAVMGALAWLPAFSHPLPILLSVPLRLHSPLTLAAGRAGYLANRLWHIM